MALVPVGVVTVTYTVPVPAGASAVIEVDEVTMKLGACADPNLTAVAPASSSPLIVTSVPPAAGPLSGAAWVTVGIGAPTATVCTPPAETPTAPVSPLTATGLSLKPPLVPSPRIPSSFAPQSMAVPLASSATPCCSPAEMAITSRKPLTATGSSNLLAVAPLPSCPRASAPQAMTVAPLSSARLKEPPAEIVLTPLKPCTATGTSLNCGSPSSATSSPSWPASSSPHAM